MNGRENWGNQIIRRKESRGGELEWDAQKSELENESICKLHSKYTRELHKPDEFSVSAPAARKSGAESLEALYFTALYVSILNLCSGFAREGVD